MSISVDESIYNKNNAYNTCIFRLEYYLHSKTNNPCTKTVMSDCKDISHEKIFWPKIIMFKI